MDALPDGNDDADRGALNEATWISDWLDDAWWWVSRMLVFESPSSDPPQFLDSLYLRGTMVLESDEGESNGWVDRGELEKEW